MKIGKFKLYYYVPYIVLNILCINSTYFRYLSFILFLLPTIFLLRKRVSYKYFALLIFYIVQFVVSCVNTSVSQSIKNTAQYILWFAPIIIFDLAIKDELISDKINDFKNVNVITQITILYCMVASWRYLQTSMYALRNIAAYDPSIGYDPRFPFAIGGGYSLLFPIAMLITLYLWVVMRSKYISKKLIYICLIVFSVLLLIKANCTTVFLVATICMLWLVLFSKNPKGTVAIFCVSAIGLLVVLLNQEIIAEIIRLVASLFDERTIIHQRLNEIIPAIYYGNSESSFGVRLFAIQKDIATILKFPIVGAGGHVGFDYLALNQYVGWHCEWLDIIAEFGIPLSALVFYVIIKSLKELYTFIVIPSQKSVFLIMAMCLFLMGICDPVMARNMLLTLFVVYPCVYKVIEYKETKNEEIINDNL